jgi:DNA-3-methyladenine glycosylase I
MESYHDREWGVPVTDDRKLFEFLILDGFQAGLSWRTILHKRNNFRKAFAGFDARRMARFSSARRDRLLTDAGIIRNRLKIEAAIANARLFLEIQAETGSFSDYLWSLAGPAPRRKPYRTLREIPARTRAAERMSKTLRKRGFRFVGPTICYAFMQAAGMVNDHLATCFRYGEVERLRKGRVPRVLSP